MKAIVIGGGIIGSSVAWRLACDGIAVTVLERARLGREASWAAAGLIGPQGEAEVPGPFFDLCMAGKAAFDATVGRLARESGIDPKYDPHGILYVALDEHDREELSARARWQRAAGAEVEELSGAKARELAPILSSRVIYALHMPTNRRVDNRKLTQAYIGAAVSAGAEFREGTQVDSVVIKAGKASGVMLHDGTALGADFVINAAGSWAGSIAGLERDRICFFPVRGQILCFDIRPGSIAHSIFSPRGILVPRRDGRLLAGSVFEDAGYNKAVTLGAMNRILSAAIQIAPEVAEVPLRETWAGLRPAANDLMPVLGPSPTVENLFYAAGHFRSGILLSALTGEIIADLIMGRPPKIDLTPFAPARFQNPIEKVPIKIKESI